MPVKPIETNNNDNLAKEAREEFIRTVTEPKKNIYHAPATVQKSPIELKREFDQKCGEIKSFYLDIPVGMSELREMSSETLRAYFENIYKKYPNLDIASIAEMLGTSSRIVKMMMIEVGVKPENASGRIAIESRKRFKAEMINVLKDIKAGKKIVNNGKVYENKPAVIDKITQDVVVDKSSAVLKAKSLKPMLWKEVKLLSEAEQKEYVEALFEKYPGISSTQFAEMMKVAKNTVNVLFRKIKIDTKYHSRANCNNYKKLPEGRARFRREMVGKSVEEENIEEKAKEQHEQFVEILNTISKPNEPEPKEDVNFDLNQPLKEKKCIHADFPSGNITIRIDSMSCGYYCDRCGKKFASDKELVEEYNNFVKDGYMQDSTACMIVDSVRRFYMNQAMNPYGYSFACPEKKASKISDITINNIDIEIDAKDVSNLIKALGINGKIRIQITVPKEGGELNDNN